MACAQEEGLNPEQDSFGGWEGFSGANRPSKNGLDEECLARAGEPPRTAAVDREMIAEYYAAEIRQYECLTAQGYPVEEPPTVESYVETYESRPAWTALSGTIGLYSEEDYESILDKCPLPDPWELFVPSASEFSTQSAGE